jgi:translocation and assembly module TamB
MRLRRDAVRGVLVCAGIVLVALALALLAPFTRIGTQALLAFASGSLSMLEVRGIDGRLAGRLVLSDVRLRLDGVELHLQGIDLSWQPHCLLAQRLCITQLHVQGMQLRVDASGKADALDPASAPRSLDQPWQLPLRVTLDSLRIGNAELQLPDVQLRWQHLHAGLRSSRTHVAIERALVDALQVSLAPSDSEPSDDWPLADLPSVDLPLSIELASLTLLAPQFDMPGFSEQLERVEVALVTANSRVQVSHLRLEHAVWGSAELRADASLQPPYRLDAQLRATLAKAPIEGLALPIDIVLSTSGHLAALNASLAVSGAAPMQGDLTIDLTQSALPFTAAFSGTEPDLAGFTTLPLRIQAWRLGALGSTDAQQLRLHIAADSPEHASRLLMDLDALHGAEGLRVNTLDLTDAAGSALHLDGRLQYADGLRAQVNVESSGIALPASLVGVAVDLRGQLHLDAALDDGWRIAITDTQLQGTLDDQTFALEGGLQLDNHWAAGNSDLALNILGARLRVRAGSALPPERQELALLAELAVPSLRTLSDPLRGDLRLELTQIGTIVDGSLQLNGQVRDVRWPDGAVPELQIVGRGILSSGFAGELEINAPMLRHGDWLLERAVLKGSVEEGRQALHLQSAGALNVDLRVSGQQQSEGWAGALAPTVLGTPWGSWELRAALPLAWGSTRRQATIAPHCWMGEGTRLCLTDVATLGAEGSGSLELSSDFAELRPYLPEALRLDTEVTVSLDAQWDTPANPQLHVRVAMPPSRLEIQGDRREPLTFAWAGLQAEGEWVDQGLKARLVLLDDTGTLLRGELSADLGAQSLLDGSLVLAALDLAPLTPLLPSLARLAGTVSADLRIAGPLDAPQVTGQVNLTGAALQLLDNPTALESLILQADFQGDTAALDGNFELGGGLATMNGLLSWQDKLTLQLGIAGQNHRLLYPPDSSAVVSQDLTLVATRDGIQLGGSATVHSGLLQLKRLPEGSVALSSDVVLVDDDNQALVESNPFNVGLDLDLAIAEQFRIDAMGFEGRLSGTMNVRQDVNQPLQVFGSVDIRDGRYRAFGQRLIMRRGLISFTGPPSNPQLDVRAERDMRNSTVVAGVSITGNARAPVVDFYSQPYMERPELLSYLLRGRGLDRGSNTGVDTSLLMATLGTGLAGSSGLLGQLERASPLRNLEISTEGAEDETQATIGGYVGDRLYVRYGMGLVEPINELMVRLYLMSNLWVEAVSSLQRSVDVFYAFDIDWSE